ncbi:hypothetical protein [Micromonospora sp. NBC_00421]|uniref:hypothetical protein n=1 Tax=Micromonospora sp. NBC_00421 TaxID=2975976 RepID=UPI002E1F810E
MTDTPSVPCSHAICLPLNGDSCLLDGAETIIEYDVEWTDDRCTDGRTVASMGYRWPAGKADINLATELRAAERFHRLPIRIRRRATTWFSDGSQLVGAWADVEVKL